MCTIHHEDRTLWKNLSGQMISCRVGAGRGGRPAPVVVVLSGCTKWVVEVGYDNTGEGDDPGAEFRKMDQELWVLFLPTLLST